MRQAPADFAHGQKGESSALLVAEALTLHRAGRLAEAEKLYRRILAKDSGHFDSLHLLGVILHQRGENAAAIRQIDLALARNPHNALVLNNRGLALFELKRLDEALASYDRALAVQADHAEAWSNRGVVLHKLRRFEEALASCDRALAARPNYAEALLNRGNALKELKRFEEALASVERALALRPDYAEALLNRGNVLKEFKRFDEAVASYDRALLLRPNYAEAHSNRGNVLYELKRFDEALSSCDRALALQPAFAETHYNRGNALYALERYGEALASYETAVALRPDAEALVNRGASLHALQRFEEALSSYDRALALRPDYADAHYNRGNALHALKRFEEALSSCDSALALRPDYPEALVNRGIILHALKRFAEGLVAYQRAQALRHDYAEAHHGEAVCRLLTGDFDRGWQKYEWRWQTGQLKGRRRNFAQPQWNGSGDIAGRTILVHAEQGFGDTIQFARYVPGVAARGARVILEVQEPLRELLRALPGITRIVSRGEPLPDFDTHCPLLSLPLAFGTQLATVPAETPYLYAPVEQAKAWAARLGLSGGPRIGLAWSGRPTHRNDRNRSIAFDAFFSSLANSDAAFVSLQKDVRDADQPALQNRGDLVHFGDALKTFADTAALIANLDLVISVDTSVAHLAGALGKPVWILLPYMPDWRWLLDREDTPWYPTARLFRQDKAGEWASVLGRVGAALRDFVRRF